MTHLWSAGMTHHGAHDVLVCCSIFSKASWYSDQCLRSSRSPKENFQFFSGVLEPLQEPLPLLLLRDVEEELQDERAVADEVALELVDVVVSATPERFAAILAWKLAQQFRMDPHHEDVLVVRAVEDPDPSPFRQGLHVAPEKVVIELLARRLLEREDLTALRVHAGHHVLDGAVLACGVGGLEHDEHRIRVGRVEPLLRIREVVDVLLQEIRRARFQLALRQVPELLVRRPVRVVVA